MYRPTKSEQLKSMKPTFKWSEVLARVWRKGGRKVSSRYQYTHYYTAQEYIHTCLQIQMCMYMDITFPIVSV